jgi:hypothetical protein
MNTRTIAGRYELVDRIGAGGGGVVWRGRDLSLDRVVAVKEIELSSELPTDERERIAARALREARAAARIEHPNVVGVYDVHSAEDAIHIVMEYVDAPSLQDLVQSRGPLAPSTVASIGVGVVDALRAAHEAGILHRDVKPSNVLVSADGAQVTDFGIAAVTGDTALTLSGETLGTPDYVSPEQVRGEELSEATDVWSLGATLYYAVEGEPPYRRERPIATVHAVVHDPPRPMTRAGPLSPVLVSLLSKDRTARPDPAAVRSRLHDVATGAAASEATAAIPAVDGPAAAAQPPQGPEAAQGPTEPVDTGAPTPPPTRTTVHTAAPPPRRGAPRGLTAIGAIVAIALVVVIALLVDRGAFSSAPGAPSPAPDETATTSAPASDAAPVPSPTASQPTAPATTAPATLAALPDGWVAYEGPSWVVGHPEGWAVEDPGIPNNLDLEAPEPEAGYLRVANTDDPATDVVRDSERIEAAFREDHADYERIRLEPTDYRDTQAAIWEYTFTEDGQTFHALHLNLSTGERGYALNHVVPADGWPAAADRFDHFTGSFSFDG